MKIAAVTVLEYVRPLDGRAWNPAWRWTERRAPLVVLEGDNGGIGIGEGWSRQAELGGQLDHLAQRIAPLACGQVIADAASIAQLGNRLGAARDPAMPVWVHAGAASALDVAAWDLLARARGEPLWRTLGARSGRAQVYASGGLYRDGATDANLAAEMREAADQGHTAFKMKVGALPLARDLGRVRTVRSAVGVTAMLWVDAVNQLDARTAPVWARAMADAGAAAFQAPVPFDDLATMARINRGIMPVVAGEVAHDPAQFEAMLAARAVGIVQPCAGLCGGITGVLRVASLVRAQARGAVVSPQTFGTAILQAAALHLGARLGPPHPVEYHRFHDHLAFLLPPAAREVAGGMVELGEAPGLGIATPMPGPQPDGGSIRLHARIQSASTRETSHA